MGWASGEKSPRALRAGRAVILASAIGFLSSIGHSFADSSQLAALPSPSSLAASAAQSVVERTTSWPTKAWPISTPEAQGIDSAILAQAIEQIEARHVPINSLLIERHGSIVLDSYFYPFANHRTHNVYSVTKSVTSMLVGIAMAEHRLTDLNSPVLSLLPLGTNDPRKARITLANLLSMTSGLDCKAEGGQSLLQQMLRSRHLAVFMMNRPEDAEPGTVFDYCGGNSEVVSAVLTRTTGSSAFEYARERLFSPLGISQVSWPTDADRVSHGWGDLELQPRDMAKLGYLWLHNGRWEDKQIIPVDYLAQALSRHINVQPGIDYGYGMWLYPGHTPVDFEANGSGGQRITVIPSLDVVEVTTGNGLDANIVAQLIAPAFRSDGTLPGNPDSDLRLASLSSDAAMPAGSRHGTIEVFAAVPVPVAKPALAPPSVLAEAAAPEMDLRVIVYPKPKPNSANVAVAEIVPIPRPKPAAHSTLIALANVPIPRPKPQLAPQFEAAVVGVATAPNAAANLRPIR